MVSACQHDGAYSIRNKKKVNVNEEERKYISELKTEVNKLRIIKNSAEVAYTRARKELKKLERTASGKKSLASDFPTNW